MQLTHPPSRYYLTSERLSFQGNVNMGKYDNEHLFDHGEDRRRPANYTAVV